MCEVIHLEPIEFVQTVSRNHLSVFSRVYVLNNGIAGLVYMCEDAHNLYYLDRFVCASQKEDELEEIDFYDIHKDIYCKINLDSYLRHRNQA